MSDSPSNVITLHNNMKIAEKKLCYNNKAFTSKRVTAKKKPCISMYVNFRACDLTRCLSYGYMWS